MLPAAAWQAVVSTTAIIVHCVHNSQPFSCQRHFISCCFPAVPVVTMTAVPAIAVMAALPAAAVVTLPAAAVAAFPAAAPLGSANGTKHFTPLNITLR